MIFTIVWFNKYDSDLKLIFEGHFHSYFIFFQDVLKTGEINENF